MTRGDDKNAQERELLKAILDKYEWLEKTDGGASLWRLEGEMVAIRGYFAAAPSAPSHVAAPAVSFVCRCAGDEGLLCKTWCGDNGCLDQRGAVNQQGCSRSEASVAAERTDRPLVPSSTRLRGVPSMDDLADGWSSWDAEERAERAVEKGRDVERFYKGEHVSLSDALLDNLYTDAFHDCDGSPVQQHLAGLQAVNAARSATRRRFEFDRVRDKGPCGLCLMAEGISVHADSLDEAFKEAKRLMSPGDHSILLRSSDGTAKT